MSLRLNIWKVAARKSTAITKNVSITFDDGTVITIGYGKENLAVWWIRIDQAGTTDPDLIICDDDEAAIYSDILEIDAEVVAWKLVDK